MPLPKSGRRSRRRRTDEASFYWETEGKSGWQALRKGKWKAHLQHVGDPARTKFELCNLSSDIAEENDISAAHPEVTREMKQLV